MGRRRFLLTHYFPEPPKPGFLKPLEYFCAVEEKDRKRYYVQGRSLKIYLEEDEIKKWTREGLISEFEKKDQEITEGQAVFLKSDGSMILASDSSPVHDENAVILGNDLRTLDIDRPFYRKESPSLPAAYAPKLLSRQVPKSPGLHSPKILDLRERTEEIDIRSDQKGDVKNINYINIVPENARRSAVKDLKHSAIFWN